MNMDVGGSLIWGIASLVLVISALAGRRLPMAEMARMALAWIAIFAILFMVFSFRFEIKQIWNRVKSDISGGSNQDAQGDIVRLKRGDDGHFSALIKVNGKPLEFMVDTGATITSLSTKSADEAGIEVDRTDYPVVVQTANGRVLDARGTAKLIQLETIRLADQSILVSDSMDGTNLLGMSFLDQLTSWRVEGDTMFLQP